MHAVSGVTQEIRAAALRGGGWFGVGLYVVQTTYGSGQGGIRTHDTLAGIPVFETGSFSHSDTCPGCSNSGRKITGCDPSCP